MNLLFVVNLQATNTSRDGQIIASMIATGTVALLSLTLVRIIDAALHSQVARIETSNGGWEVARMSRLGEDD